MKKACLLFALSALCTALLGAVPAAYADAPADTDGLLVVFEDGTAPATAARVLEAAESSDVDIVRGRFAEPHAADKASATGADAATGVAAASLAERVSGYSVHLAKVDVAEGATAEQAMAELAADPHVKGVQPNYVYRLDDAAGASGAAGVAGAAGQGSAAAVAGAAGAGLTAAGAVPARVSTNDPYATNSRTWQLDAIGARDAWEYARGNNAVTVCVMDTGIQMDHIDLKANIVAPYDVTGDARGDSNASVPDDSPDDQDGHGTHVAGIIAARANNGYGIAGVSYNANIMPMRVFFYSARYRESITESIDVAAALAHLLSRAPADMNEDGVRGTIAEEYNVRVINMSFGGAWPVGEYADEHDQVVLDLIDQAFDAGILTVCAAGNDGDGEGAHWPSDHDTCISVIALDSDDSRAPYSNYGRAKDISAPGTSVYSTLNRSEGARSGTDVETVGDSAFYYGPMSGTSMASPVVAGSLALMFASNPNLSAQKAREALYDTADDLGEPGRDDGYGWGKVNLLAAVKRVAYRAVESVDGLPDSIVAGEAVRLRGVVYPDDATRKGITYRIVDAGDTKATLSGTILQAEAVGTVKLEAQIANGIDIGCDFSLEFDVDVVPADLEGVAVLAGVDDAYTYAGKAIEPAPTVQVGGKTLAAGVDYTVGYGANLDVGEGSVQVTGIGNYTGSLSASFRIEAAPLSGVTVAPIAERAYNGRMQRPAVRASLGSWQLVEGLDFTCTYANNVQPGTAQVTLSGCDNFTGTRTLSFQIADTRGSAPAGQASASQTQTAAQVQAGSSSQAAQQQTSQPAAKAKAVNGLSAKGKTVAFKASKLKKKALSAAAGKAFAVKGANGKVTYKVSRYGKGAKGKVSVSKAGKVTVKKGTKKGAYALKVKVTAAGDSAHKPATKTVTLKVRVK